MNKFPMIRLQVEGMQHSLIHYMQEYHGDFEKFMEEEIKRQLSTLEADYGKIVEEQVRKVIKEKIDNYFKYGNGAKLVGRAVNDSLNMVFGMQGDEGI